MRQTVTAPALEVPGPVEPDQPMPNPPGEPEIPPDPPAPEPARRRPSPFEPSRPMLRQGPIPRFLHGFIEYAAAVLFFVAPFVLDFQAGAATAASIIAGVVVLFVAASTEGPTSLINYVPLAAHVVLDYALALVLIAIPFIAGFSDETAPTVFFIAIGVLHLLVTIGTRFRPVDRRDDSAGRRRRRPRAAEPG